MSGTIRGPNQAPGGFYSKILRKLLLKLIILIHIVSAQYKNIHSEVKDRIEELERYNSYSRCSLTQVYLETFASHKTYNYFLASYK